MLSAWSDAKVSKHLNLMKKAVLASPKTAPLWAAATAIKSKRRQLKYLVDSLHELDQVEDERRKYKGNRLPVGVREFIESKNYMNKKGIIWPKLLDEIEEACSGKYVEGVFTGGIGSGKSTAALYIQAYLLYLLSRMKDPHGEFGLDPSSEILIVFQSLNTQTAKTVEFDRFADMVKSAPYFQRHFRPRDDLESILKFPSRIIVKHISGAETAAIGQNVISAIIDEVNFMAVIEKSAKARDGGTYNQAIELYNSIVRRRESRFMKKGRCWGLLCLVSSARYPGQFTDKRKEAAKRQIDESGSTTIYIYDKRGWDVMDPDRDDYPYTGPTFRLFLGDLTRKPMILKDSDKVARSDIHLVMDIPIEHKHAFQDDIYDAIRDIAGMATMSTHPFIPYPEKIAAAFGRVENVFSREDCDFVTTKVAIYPKRIVNRTASRFAHFDLSETGDSTGLVIGHVKGFVPVKRGSDVEILPEIVIDAILEIKPPVGGEIDYSKCREILYKLRELGLPIRWVSYDGYNSYDSIQMLKQKGFYSGVQSMDVTPVPYEITKQAIIDGRLSIPDHQKCQIELATLERDPVKGKIDHPEYSSKDVSDCLAGVVYGLTMRREIWVQHGISPQSIPRSVRDAAQTHKKAVEGGLADAKN